MKQIYLVARSFGPYLMLALLVPGGSLIAPLLWLARRHKKEGDSDVHTVERNPAGNGARLDAGDARGLCAGKCA